MLDFDMKPREKTTQEKAFDKLSAEYEAKFGKPYVIYYGLNEMTMSETLSDIRTRIDRNEPHTAPDYKPGEDY